MEQAIIAMVRQLRTASTFEEGCGALLSSLSKWVTAALADSPYCGQGHLCCAMVHLRPDESYRGLVVWRPGAGLVLAPETSLLPSLTAWRLLKRHDCPLALDVHLARIQRLDGQSLVDVAACGDFDRTASRQRLLDRQATHLYALPLRGPQGRLSGMVVLEVQCRAAMGRPFVWQETACGEALQLLIDIAAPTLLGAPLRADSPTAVDAHLPVVGQAMAGIVQLLGMFARQRETILITGPTGAGKSRLAGWCHQHSGRPGALVNVNLLTVPEDLQMAELFGWRKGSFTGAVTSREGCVAQAEGGTLFIDEIDKLSLKAQAGLLELLETRHYRPLGESGDTRRADVRFIVATNADLLQAVEAKRFREDLYYRINVLPVRLPSLGERIDEIPGWAQYMVNRHHAAMAEDAIDDVSTGDHPATLSAEAVLALTRQPWPGNLRQLDNVIRRAYAVAWAATAPAAQALVIDAGHVAQALAFETATSATPELTVALERAAEAYVALALERQTKGRSMGLDHTGALRALVLEAAQRRLGNLKDAYRLFGGDALVDSRNHTKDYRRALAKVTALHQLLQDAPQAHGQPSAVVVACDD
ncbi:MAG: sigma-54-dependent transcriptional regulator [Candidatus Competibacterales bacterium]